MGFTATWATLLENVDELPADATLITPLSGKEFVITDTQQHRVLTQYRDDDETIPLQQDQFETLYRRINEAGGEFELDRLPPDAEPYATVLSLHPRFEVNKEAATITETDQSTGSPLVRAQQSTDDTEQERNQPDLAVYADALLLIDLLERQDVSHLDDLETSALVNLYTLLSDVQRSADELRTDVRALLLDRLHHDQPVSGQYGSVQRTTRRNRSLKDDQHVFEVFESAGVDRDKLTTVDTSKVDDALDVTDVAETDVYEIDQSEYVRKADVNDQQKETRLQGLKDQLAATDTQEADDLREEIQELEDRIDELTEFRSGRSFHDPSQSQ